MHLSIVIAYEIFSSIDFTLDIRGPHDLYSLKQNQFQTYLVCKHDFVLIPYMLKKFGFKINCKIIIRLLQKIFHDIN